MKKLALPLLLSTAFVTAGMANETGEVVRPSTISNNTSVSYAALTIFPTAESAELPKTEIFTVGDERTCLALAFAAVSPGYAASVTCIESHYRTAINSYRCEWESRLGLPTFADGQRVEGDDYIGPVCRRLEM